MKYTLDERIFTTLGRVIDVETLNDSSLTMISVEYEVDNQKFIRREQLVLKEIPVMLGRITLRTKVVPCLEVNLGDMVRVCFEMNCPWNSYLPGNML